ncbi:ABC transporter ATP-binding protein [Sphingomonas montana]|uniref:ABC transporter ATP-binding protein n=1 Tax=Sphingomonas montana TaxID=1843236 RepID=UPI00096C4871|nr:ATP-binding cassette domain-containing protein [Sphingomonas montana]
MKSASVPIDQATPAVHLRDVRVRRGERIILDSLTFSVGRGEIYALLGGNGAGKSTAIATILGFLPYAGGAVRVCGDDPARDGYRVRGHIAYLPENVALYEHLTAVENIAYFLAVAGQRRSPDAVMAALNSSGLQAEAHERRLVGFSKGMRQKVAIALAILREVPVFLLDEPTSGLDPSASSDFNALLLRLRNAGAAIVMVTHDLLGVVDCADRIGFLESGRIADEAVASGPDRFDLRELHARYGKRVLAA